MFAASTSAVMILELARLLLLKRRHGVCFGFYQPDPDATDEELGTHRKLSRMRADDSNGAQSRSSRQPAIGINM